MANVSKIESNDLNLNDLFMSFYSVPDFQREYVWVESNVEKLLGDIYDELYDENDRLTGESEYFIGSIVVCSDDSGAYQLIDGQQRLTTNYLTLCVVRDYLKELGSPPSTTLKNQIGASSMSPRTGEDVFRFRLALQYEDSHGVLATIAEGEDSIETIAITTESVKHIVDAYTTIKEFLVYKFGDDPAKIKQFIAAFIHQVKLIRIITPDLTHALKVFETINDRGIGLNAMDLLKNLLFMKTKSEDYPQLKKQWKLLIDNLNRSNEKPLRFLRYFIMSQFPIEGSKPVAENEIYDWFVRHSGETEIGTTPLRFVDRLVARSQDYANFVEKKNPQGEANRYLNNIALSSGAARQHFILLLAGQHLAKDLFNHLCRNLENLFFCYIVTRESTKQFEKTFSKWALQLRQVTDETGFAAFIEENFTPDLQARLNDFDFAFQELSQSRIQHYRMRYILAKLAQFIERAAWGNSAHDNLDQYITYSVDIEHILPRTPLPEVRAGFDKPSEYDAYAERLGNLTLLEKTINTSISNGPFEKKRDGYMQSSFLLTKSLVSKPQVGIDTQLNRAVSELIQFETWKSTDIEQRQAMIGKLARKVWEMPDRSFEPIPSNILGESWSDLPTEVISLRTCAKCGRSYDDIEMNFCLDDGSPLVSEKDISDLETVVRPAPKKEIPRASSRNFMREHFPELKQYPTRTSRRYESTEKSYYWDNWWVSFNRADLDTNEFLILAGSLDNTNTEFKVFKIPTSYVLANLDKLDVGSRGMINLYIDFKSFEDLRNDARLPFGQFAVN